MNVYECKTKHNRHCFAELKISLYKVFFNPQSRCKIQFFHMMIMSIRHIPCHISTAVWDCSSWHMSQGNPYLKDVITYASSYFLNLSLSSSCVIDLYKTNSSFISSTAGVSNRHFAGRMWPANMICAAPYDF